MIVESDFAPPRWLRNPHLQTLWPYAARHSTKVRVRRERLELPDGDFIDLDWGEDGADPPPGRRGGLTVGGPEQRGLVIGLHGLSGSVDSHYARSLLRSLARRGRRGVIMNFRGASGEPNRLARGYHGGETGDLSTVVEILRRREPDTPLAAVGYSLGANVLLKWLGEQGRKAPLSAAVAVSVPFDLSQSTTRLTQGLSRVYQWHILRSLKEAVIAKARIVEVPVDLKLVRLASTFRRFDDLVTAPLHGFQDADQYYRLSSAVGYLGDIRVPTLIVHSLDDPFVPASAVPGPAALSDSTLLEITRYGGHVGFVGRGRVLSSESWLDGRIAEFLGTRIARRPPDPDPAAN